MALLVKRSSLSRYDWLGGSDGETDLARSSSASRAWNTVERAEQALWEKFVPRPDRTLSPFQKLKFTCSRMRSLFIRSISPR